jgi:hypothetical protein
MLYVDEGERDILPNELEARGAFHIARHRVAGYRRKLVRPIELSAGSGYSATWTIGIRGVGGYPPLTIEILD